MGIKDYQSLFKKLVELIMNNYKNLFIKLLIIFSLFHINSIAQNLPLRLDDGAGTIRLGVICNDNSWWLDESKIEKNGNSYIIENKNWAKGKVQLNIHKLLDTKGIVIEVKSLQIPENSMFCWAFGGCSGKNNFAESDLIQPKECKDNVYSTEGNSFTVYYGEVMKLQTVCGIVPEGSEMLLSNAHKQTTPLEHINSGKKSDATTISSIFKIEDDKPIYICLYKQNNKADYNYFMLEELFNKSLK